MTLKCRQGVGLIRDPIEEKGGRNLYGFVGNNAVAAVDYLGLCAPSCGCDATLKVNDTLREVAITFRWKWSRAQQLDACEALDNITVGGVAWDMSISEPTSALSGPCELTATFANKCFKQSAINYALFGRMGSLCSSHFGNGVPGGRWSLEYMTGLAQLFKWGFHEDFTDEANQAFAFVSWGFGFGLNYNGRDHAIKKSTCVPSDKKCKGDRYTWKWVPHRPDFE